MNVVAFTDAIASVCPVTGVSIGDAANKTTWRINYATGATAAQQAAAQSVMATWTDPIRPRQVTGTQFMAALVDLGIKAFFDQAATLSTKPLDAWYYHALTPNDFYLENNAKIVRLSTKAIALGAAAVPSVVFTLASIVDKAVTE